MMPNPNDKEWTDEDIAALRRYWVEGEGGNRLSAGQIGRRLNRSKNSVLGKVHRIGLPARPSTIVRGGIPAAPKPERMKAREAKYFTSVIVQIEQIRSSPPVMLKSTARPQPCCWPVGDPRSSSFRYCEAPGVPGRPYCLPHQRISVEGYADMLWYPERDAALLEMTDGNTIIWEILAVLNKMPGIKLHGASQTASRLGELRKMKVAA
jgi:GcrA cell cycle regulator